MERRRKRREEKGEWSGGAGGAFISGQSIYVPNSLMSPALFALVTPHLTYTSSCNALHWGGEIVLLASPLFEHCVVVEIYPQVCIPPSWAFCLEALDGGLF